MTADDPPDDEEPGPAEWLRRWQGAGDRDSLDQLLRVEIGELKRRLASRAHAQRLRISPQTTSGIAVDAAADVANAGTHPRFADLAAFRAYLWKAAQHLLLRHLRRRAARAGDVSLEECSGVHDPNVSRSGPVRAAERADEAALLRFVLTFLDPEARDLVERAHLREEDIGSIAESLALTREAVEMRLVRIRRRLAAKLKAWRSLMG